ncbi:MAG: hypothetical protein IKL82_04540 [Clostridia bacterium]|nr:hypothetical protein [Clostridia bacterium]
MKNGKLIALSAITTALGLVFLAIGAYIETLDLSCLFMASLVLTLPLAKNSVKGALLTYLATAILSLVIGAGRFSVSLTYALFFGIHPILNYLQTRGGKKRFYIYFIKLVLFLISAYLMVYMLNMFVFENEFIIKYLPIIVFVGGTLLFIVYDFCMVRFQKYTNIIVNRLGL